MRIFKMQPQPQPTKQRAAANGKNNRRGRRERGRRATFSKNVLSEPCQGERIR